MVDYHLHTLYTVKGYFGEEDGLDYINTIEGLLYNTDPDEEGAGIIGRVVIQEFLLSAAINNGENLFFLFDNPHFLWEEGFLLIDHEQLEFKGKVQRAFDNLLLDLNGMLLIKNLELLPTYRGKGIGRLWLMDIYRRFTPGNDLFIIEIDPSQFYNNYGDAWKRKMRFNRFTKDEKLALNRLHAHYSKMGFVQVDDTTLRLLATQRINKF